MYARFLTGIVICAVLATATSVAQAQLPQGKILRYRLREIPNDPDSAVIFAVTLSLTEADSDGDWLGWQVDKVTLQDIGTTGEPEASWSDALPLVDTTDGLWWIEHVDPDSPMTSEFTVPPLLFGLATAFDPSNADMEYVFEGSFLTSPTASDSAVTYVFTSDGESEPAKEGEDEPAEVDEQPEDPMSAQ